MPFFVVHIIAQVYNMHQSHLQFIAKEELVLRRQKIQAAMLKAGAEGCLLSTSVNLLYMTGQVINGYVYIPAEGEAWHFIRRPAGMTGTSLRYIRKVEDIPGLLADLGLTKPSNLMVESGEMSHMDLFSGRHLNQRYY